MNDGDLFLQAIRDGDLDRVEIMLVESPDLVEVEDDAGVSAILTAVYYNKLKIADLLLSQGKPLSIWEAAAVGQFDRVAELIGEDQEMINAYAPDGFTPLGLAAYFGHPDLLYLLLQQGALPNRPAKNAAMVCPIHSAVAHRRPEVTLFMVSELIDHGADVNAVQQGGWTPLHQAAASGQVELVKMLFEKGADVHLLSNEGKSALDMARERNQQEVVSFLKDLEGAQSS